MAINLIKSELGRAADGEPACGFGVKPGVEQGVDAGEGELDLNFRAKVFQMTDNGLEPEFSIFLFQVFRPDTDLEPGPLIRADQPRRKDVDLGGADELSHMLCIVTEADNNVK